MGSKTMLGGLIDIVEAFAPVDLNTAGNNGDWLNMKNVESVVVLVGSGVGTAGEDFTVDLQQAVDNSGGSVKALNMVTSPAQTHKKQAATSLAAVTSWTDAVDDVTSAALTNTDNAEQDALYAIEVKPSDLDVSGGFDHIRIKIDDDMTNAMPGFAVYIVRGKYQSNPDDVITYLD